MERNKKERGLRGYVGREGYVSHFLRRGANCIGVGDGSGGRYLSWSVSLQRSDVSPSLNGCV